MSKKSEKEEMPASVSGRSPNSEKDSSHHQILVFVSFSLPHESLKGFSDALETHGDVKLVLRGLIDDSLEKTARRLQDVRGVMEINPDLFERYHVERVPTFILVKNGQPVAKLMGNISLPYAKEIFSEKGWL